MSDIVATLPQGTQVVLEANLLTSDVDQAIEEVRQEVQRAQGGGGRVSSRTLFCRKCEGHGQQVVLKGHASRCPFNNCTCKTCSNVMSMRANAIIRRYRTRTLEGGFVLKPVHFKNGNTRLRVFPKYVDETDALPIPQHAQAAAMRERNVSGEQTDLTKIRTNQIVPQTPPVDAVPLAPFPVHRADSKELEIIRDVSPIEEARETAAADSSPAKENPPTNVPDVSLSILDLLFNRNNLQFPSNQSNGMSTNDLIANGLLPLTSASFNLNGFGNFDQQQNQQQNNLFYSTPASTYANAFMPITSSTNTYNQMPIDRKTSEVGLVYPTLAQLSELNIGVTSSSPTAIPTTSTTSHPFAAPILTPQVYEEARAPEIKMETPEVAPEPFTDNLMIAPNANRSHPFFKKFLNTVKELEKQMLFSMDTE